MKKPKIVATFGMTFANEANETIIILFPIAKKKLLPGDKRRLEIAMGMKKTNDDRPFEISAGTSLKIKAIVSNSRKKNAAIFGERLLIIKSPTLPKAYPRVPKSNRLFPGLSQDDREFITIRAVKNTEMLRTKEPANRIFNS